MQTCKFNSVPSKSHLIEKGGKDLKCKGEGLLLLQLHSDIYVLTRILEVNTGSKIIKYLAEVPLLSGGLD